MNVSNFELVVRNFFLFIIKGPLQANFFNSLIDGANAPYHFAANPVKFDRIFSIYTLLKKIIFKTLPNPF